MKTTPDSKVSEVFGLEVLRVGPLMIVGGVHEANSYCGRGWVYSVSIVERGREGELKSFLL